MDYKNDHPERHANETYLGNMTYRDFSRCVGWHSKRLGRRAFMIDGTPIDRRLPSQGEEDTRLWPAFAKTAEISAAKRA